jgi:hypothetical protein
VSTAQLVIVCLSALLAVGIVALAAVAIADVKRERAPERAVSGPSLVGKSLVVHTRKPDDQSVRGVVDAHYADRLVLRDAAYLHASGAQSAGGLVDVLLINVSSWQELQAPAAEGT